jgi:hypothetical protein
MQAITILATTILRFVKKFHRNYLKLLTATEAGFVPTPKINKNLGCTRDGNRTRTAVEATGF